MLIESIILSIIVNIYYIISVDIYCVHVFQIQIPDFSEVSIGFNRHIYVMILARGQEQGKGRALRGRRQRGMTTATATLFIHT